jgi:peptide deformylase
MSKFRVRLYGDPVLRKHAAEVAEFGESLRSLAADMVETMLEEDGIGLAAPQIGLSTRLMVIGLPTEEEGKRRVLTMANPEILEEDEEIVTMEEGCLSLPGLAEDVDRPDYIKVRYQDVEGNEQLLETDGILSRVIQHELDHLNGVLFVDHISPLKRSLLRGRLKELEKESRKAASLAGS